MKWRPLSYDPLTGTRTFHAYDSVTKKNHIRHEYAVTPILDMNAVELSHSSTNWKGDWHKVAEIPMGIIHKWANEEGLNFYDKNCWDAIKKRLNSNEYRRFRTKSGNI